MSQSGLTPYQDELLEILAEECAEVIQEKSKIFRFGILSGSHHNLGKSHIECLESELGDLLAMIQLLMDADMGLSDNRIHAAKLSKLAKLSKWMTNDKPQ